MDFGHLLRGAMGLVVGTLLLYHRHRLVERTLTSAGSQKYEAVAQIVTTLIIVTLISGLLT